MLCIYNDVWCRTWILFMLCRWGYVDAQCCITVIQSAMPLQCVHSRWMIVTTGVNDDNMCHCVMYSCSMCIANVLTVVVRCRTCRNRSEPSVGTACVTTLWCCAVFSMSISTTWFSRCWCRVLAVQRFPVLCSVFSRWQLTQRMWCRVIVVVATLHDNQGC